MSFGLGFRFERNESLDPDLCPFQAGRVQKGNLHGQDAILLSVIRTTHYCDGKDPSQFLDECVADRTVDIATFCHTVRSALLQEIVPGQLISSKASANSTHLKSHVVCISQWPLLSRLYAHHGRMKSACTPLGYLRRRNTTGRQRRNLRTCFYHRVCLMNDFEL